MATICQQCGGEGFSDSLIYCDECEDCAVHRYCLKILPKTFDEYVSWLCEDCESKSIKASALASPHPLPIKESETLETVQLNRSRPTKRLEKKSKAGKVSVQSLTDPEALRPQHCSSHEPYEVNYSENGEKHQELGKHNGAVEGRSGEAAVFQSKLSSAASDSRNLEDCGENCEKDQTLRRHNEFGGAEFHEEAESVKTENSQIAATGLQDLAANLCIEGQKDQKLDCCRYYKQTESHEIRNSQLSDCNLLGLGMDFCAEGEKDQNFGRYHPFHDPCFPEEVSPKAESSQPVDCDLQLQEMDCCNDAGNNQNLGRQNVLDKDRFNEEAESKNFQPAIIDSPNAPGCCSPHVHVQPIKDPIWRGSFNTQFGSVGGLIAHLSNIACSRAWEKAKSLPNLVLSELLPISAVSPKYFEKFAPSDDSIALYFFPDNERDEKVFDCLVKDMISQKLAMKAVLEDAELLIFTSTMLPMDYWRFAAKMYLWGVFKGKKASCVLIDVVPIEEKQHIKAITWDAHGPVRHSKQ